jgi:hypothetical protein
LVDIVAIELPDDLQLKFNIVFWKPTDLATEPPNIGAKIHILEQLNDVNEEPAYNDISASMGTLQSEGQAFIDNAIAHISFGHSGTLVYRFVHCNDAKHEVIDEARIQGVGLIVGAKKIGGSRPEMVLLDRVLPILTLWEDYLDESGIVIINH